MLPENNSPCRAGWLIRRFCLAILLLLPLASPVGAKEPVEVVIKGVEDEVRKNVETALMVPEALTAEGEVNRFWVERFIRQVPENVRAAMEPFGYYNASVSTRLETLGQNLYRLTVEIKPGKAVRIEKIRVALEGAGSSQEALTKLVGKFPLKRGDVLRQDKYEAAKGALMARAVDLGYLNADFSIHLIRVEPSREAAQVELVLDTGPLFLFDDTTLQGAPEYPESFLRRYLTYKAGDDFSYAQLGQTQLNFLNSDRFRDVVVTPKVKSAKDLRVPVEIRLTPSPSRRLRPGIGYGTDTGARVSLIYKDVNVFGGGEEFSTDFVIAQLSQILQSNLILPSAASLNSYTAFRAGLQRETLITYDSQSIFVEVERLRGFSHGRLGSVFLRFLQENSDVSGETANAHMLMPGVRFSQNGYTDIRRPKSGYKYSLEARGGHQYLGSSLTLAQVLASANTLLPLPGRFSLFLRVNSGVSIQSDPLSDIPASLRFFAGGDNSVRGYSYQSLGPKNSKGDVVGGKNLLVGSIQLERAIFENWGVVVFYDAGNAFNSFVHIDLAQGAGIGVRWYTPVGPVRVDLAREVGVSNPSIRVHVGVGFAF
jgi:translocation and assembly module TamA